MRFAGGMGIERFGAEDERRADACYEIFLATKAADNPDGPPMSRRAFRGWLKTGWVGDPRETWLLEDDGIEGWFLLELPAEANEHMISINETLGYYLLGKPARSWELPAAQVKGVKGIKGVKGVAQS